MSGDLMEFWVAGMPVPQGSKKIGRQGARPVVIDDNGPALEAWRTIVALRARRAWAGRPMLTGPVVVRLEFWMPRPATVTRWRPSVKPDGDKLERAVWDALTTARVWKDDGQVVEWSGSLHYAEPELGGPGVLVSVRELVEAGI